MEHAKGLQPHNIAMCGREASPTTRSLVMARMANYFIPEQMKPNPYISILTMQHKIVNDTTEYGLDPLLIKGIRMSLSKHPDDCKYHLSNLSL